MQVIFYNHEGKLPNNRHGNFLWKLILTSLEYFNVESSWKLRWCRDQDFNGSKIRETIEGWNCDPLICNAVPNLLGLGKSQEVMRISITRIRHLMTRVVELSWDSSTLSMTPSR